MAVWTCKIDISNVHRYGFVYTSISLDPHSYSWLHIHRALPFTRIINLQRKLDNKYLTIHELWTITYDSLFTFWIQACNELLLWITKPSSFKIDSKLRFWINVITIFICNTYFCIICLESMIAIPNLRVSIFQ